MPNGLFRRSSTIGTARSFNSLCRDVASEVRNHMMTPLPGFSTSRISGDCRYGQATRLGGERVCIRALFGRLIQADLFFVEFVRPFQIADEQRDEIGTRNVCHICLLSSRVVSL